jgi:hypothetical protein
VVLDAAVVVDLPQHLLCRISSPDDEQPRVLFLIGFEKGKESGAVESQRRGSLDIDPDKQAGPADEHKGDQGIHDEDASRKTLKVTDEQEGKRDRACTDHRCFDDVDEIGDAHVAPHAAVEAKPSEGRDLQRDNPWQGMPEKLPLLRRYITFETNEIGQYIRGADEAHVDDIDDPEILISNEVFHLNSFVLNLRPA